MNSRVRAVVCLLVAAGLMTAIAVAQHRLTTSEATSWTGENLAYLPQTDRLKPFLLGFHTTFAGYLWIKTTLYFGSHVVTDESFPWLATMLDMVTKLNPRFYPAYEFTVHLLPDLGKRPEAARVILERGISALEPRRRWRLLFHTGWFYHEHLHDNERAAEYIARAARYEEAPPYVAGLSATFLRDAGKERQALAFLQSMYHTTGNPQVKKYLARKLEEFGRGPQ